jgi:hypothetical protein
MDLALDEALIAAQKKAAAALRGWPIAAGRDLTDFEGFSLAGAFRFDLAIPLADLFRQAALGRDPRYGGFLEDDGKKMFSPLPDFSLDWRRDDLKARALRAFCALARAVPRSKKAVLVLGSPSNRPLWPYWAPRAEELGFGLDFALGRPPGLRNALASLRRGARVFDPAPTVLSADQTRRLARMRAELTELSALSAWRGLFHCDGHDFADEFTRSLFMPFLSRLEGMAAKCLAYEKALLLNLPSLVLLPEDSSSDARLLLTLGKKHGVPVWLLEHGFPSAGYTTDEVLICGDLDADRILAWGETDKGNYRKLGVPEERLEVAGSPGFDRFLPAPPPRPLTQVGGSAILVLGQLRIWSSTLYYEGCEERQFLETAGLLRRLGAARILFKVHPGLARAEYFRGLAERLPPGCPIDFYKDENFHDVLAQADAAVGPASTAIFETMLRGKDYFLFHLSPGEIPPPLSTSNDFVARDAAALESNLRERRPVPRQALREFCGIEGGERPDHFSRRVCERISAEISAR